MSARVSPGWINKLWDIPVFCTAMIITHPFYFEWVRTIKKHMVRLEAAECFGDFLKLGLGKPEQLKGYKQILFPFITLFT